MSYSILINSNSNDALNLTKTRDLLKNIIIAYEIDNALISSLEFDVSNIKQLAKWSDDLVKLMSVSGSSKDVILEPAGLNS